MAKLGYRIFWNNNASAALTTQLESGVTSIVVDDGSPFSTLTGGLPSATFCMYLTLDDGANLEVVRLIGRSGNTLTVVRGQEGTSGTQVWPVGRIIENRMTAETLKNMEVGESYAGSIAIGVSSDTDATDSIAIGNSAYAGEGAAGSGSHVGQISIGSGATTKWNGSIAIGLGAKANPASSVRTSSIAIGEGAQSIANSSIHIGEGNDVTTGITDGDYGITIGQFSNNEGINSVLIGYTAEMRSGSNNAVLIGYNAVCSSNGGICIGQNSYTDGNDGAVYGSEAATLASGVAMGYQTTAVGAYSTAIGGQRVSYHVGTIAEPPAVCPREDGNYSVGGDASHLISRPVTVTFPPMDLGVPQTWTTATTYDDQEVVVDPTPTGTEQHYLVIGEQAVDPQTDAYYIGDSFILNQSTEGTEPTWSGTQGGTANAAETDSSWVMIDPQSGVELDVSGFFNSSIRFRFIPTKIGFYCYELTGTHTTKPAFNFGNELSDTAYLTGETVDLITASNQMQWFDITPNDTMIEAAENLKITQTVAGDGALFQGKFVVEGIIMALRG